MPHARKRQILDLLIKRLSFFPVVGLLGPRQVGKSTVLREMLGAERPIRYVTMDRREMKEQAQASPSHFVEALSGDGITVCIDEVQKVPDLFDAIKADVDERKRPGKFAISGSVEFSKKTGVRESLTGRIGLLRLFPMNLQELYSLPQVNRWVGLFGTKKCEVSLAQPQQIEQWLQKGGMPGMCFTREEAAFSAMMDAWVETTCTRDLQLFKIRNFDPDLARDLLIQVARQDSPSLYQLSRALNRDPRIVRRYVEAFLALFVLHKIDPHPSGSGKTEYHLFDAGLAAHLGATRHKRLKIWVLNECLSQMEYAGDLRPRIYYYQSQKGSRVDYWIETREGAFALAVSEEEAPSSYSLRAAKTLAKKMPELNVWILAPVKERFALASNLSLLPWVEVG